jgi:DNA modification methylase
MSNLTLEYHAPGDLSPDPKNPRHHPKNQIAALKKAICEFGFTNPILTDGDLTIIAGHGRWIAATDLGLQEVPVVRLPIRGRRRKTALRIADNKLGQLSSWNLDLLAEQVSLLVSDPDVRFDVEAIGMTVGEVDSLLTRDRKIEPADEVIPAAPEEPVTRNGDIWVLDGRHRIGCGDCRGRRFLQSVVAGRADAAFLDPPYNIVINGHAVGKGKVKHREFAFASGEMSRPEFEAFLIDTLGACADASSDEAVHFVCMDHHHVGELTLAGEAVYGRRLNICVWNKSNAGMGSLYRSKHELIFVYAIDEKRHRNNVELGKHGRHRSNVWDYPSVNTFGGSRRHDLALHPTVKPVALVADAIKDVTRRGDLVLDAFLGSGTTLIACERTGRLARGVEVDASYVDLAIDRWRGLTGGDVVLEQTGETFDQVRARRLEREAV